MTTATIPAALLEAKKSFFQETKKAFPSCTFACLNVDQFAFRSVWGDFKSREDATKALRMWSAAFKGGKPEAKMFEGQYRVSVIFEA